MFSLLEFEMVSDRHPELFNSDNKQETCFLMSRIFGTTVSRMNAHNKALKTKSYRDFNDRFSISVHLTNIAVEHLSRHSLDLRRQYSLLIFDIFQFSSHKVFGKKGKVKDGQSIGSWEASRVNAQKVQDTLFYAHSLMIQQSLKNSRNSHHFRRLSA